MKLEIGLKGESQFVVSDNDLATALGGSAEVLASPILINFVELTCVQASDFLLPVDETTVGYEFHLSHLAPTPGGWTVTVEVELTKIVGKLLTFSVVARDQAGEICKGEHIRCVVNLDAFEKRKNKRLGITSDAA